MFPGIFGFHWDIGHIIFLGAFYAALTTIAVTLVRSWMRTRNALNTGRESSIRWKVDFHDLPERSRRCRHELSGEVEQRECPNGFDCRVCDNHASFAPAPPAAAPEFEILGITVPLDRRYHRGHTWVRGERDGTFVIGLDPLATRILGGSAAPELPVEGTELSVNGSAWKMRIGEREVRILSPLNGTVTAVSDGSEGWFLKVHPGADSRTTHLLCGSEIEPWMSHEVERLERALGGAVLADGGTLVENPGAGYPKDVWTAACEELFLHS